MGYGRGWRPYVSVAKRRARAAKKIAKLKKSGRELRPVEIAGRKIARTFWGESWCGNLEAYSDFANRLPRGRTYARNGSVIDLQIEAGRVRALISGSSFYRVDIEIKPLANKRWKAIKKQCAGKIDSIVELLKGSISKGVMEIVTRHGEGLFPAPREISLNCSCPDWADMCKHVAAALYGVGARLDQEPGMLFVLRGVDPVELIDAAVADISTTRKKKSRGRILKTEEISSVFGIDLDLGADEEPRGSQQVRTGTATKKNKKKTKKTKKKTTKKKSASTKPAAKKKPSAKKTKTVAKRRAAKKTGAAKAATKKAAVGKRRKTAAKKVATRKAAKKKTKGGTPTATRRKKASTRSRKKS